MDGLRSLPRLGVSAICLAALTATTNPARAQLISIKTVPVADGDQFAIFPSANLGMGGLSIAIADTLYDPFRNPARAARLRRPLFFGSPVMYSVSRNGGGGWTVPLGGIGRSGSTFGGFALALQELDQTPRNAAPGFAVLDVLLNSATTSAPAARNYNRFAYAMLGRSEAGFSVAGSLFWSGLRAIDGVDLLYAQSQDVRQRGSTIDLRLGLAKEWPGDRSLEVVLLHNRFSATHDVSYADRLWDPGARQFSFVPRVEHNADLTRTWGLHLKSERPIWGASGWRLGGVVTANRLAHPKLPNYEIMNIPRDPGNSLAYNLGLGLARARGLTTVGLDLLYEPIWSHTWADAAEPVETVTGKLIPAGGRTIENRFQFSNALLRAGVSRDLAITSSDLWLRFQLGLQLRGIHYDLDQFDHVQNASRHHQQSWIEATRTWGLSLRFPDLELHYRGRLTSGTGRPGLALSDPPSVTNAQSGRSVLIAPSGPLTLDDVRVTTHQISVSLPIR